MPKELNHSMSVPDENITKPLPNESIITVEHDSVNQHHRVNYSSSKYVYYFFI